MNISADMAHLKQAVRSVTALATALSASEAKRNTINVMLSAGDGAEQVDVMYADEHLYARVSFRADVQDGGEIALSEAYISALPGKGKVNLSVQGDTLKFKLLEESFSGTLGVLVDPDRVRSFFTSDSEVISDSAHTVPISEFSLGIRAVSLTPRSQGVPPIRIDYTPPEKVAKGEEAPPAQMHFGAQDDLGAICLRLPVERVSKKPYTLMVDRYVMGVVLSCMSGADDNASFILDLDESSYTVKQNNGHFPMFVRFPKRQTVVLDLEEYQPRDSVAAFSEEVEGYTEISVSGVTLSSALSQVTQVNRRALQGSNRTRMTLKGNNLILTVQNSVGSTKTSVPVTEIHASDSPYVEIEADMLVERLARNSSNVKIRWCVAGDETVRKALLIHSDRAQSFMPVYDTASEAYGAEEGDDPVERKVKKAGKKPKVA